MLQDNGVRNLFALIQAVRDSLEDGYDDTEYLTGEAGLEEDPVAEEESGGEEDDEAYETWSEEEAWNENWEEKDGNDANAGEPEPAEPAENQEEDAPEPEHPAGKKRRSSLTRARSSKKLRRMGSYRKKKSGISIASSAPDTPPAKLPRKDTGESYVDPVTASKQAELDSILAMIGQVQMTDGQLLDCTIIGMQFHLYHSMIGCTGTPANLRSPASERKPSAGRTCKPCQLVTLDHYCLYIDLYSSSCHVGKSKLMSNDTLENPDEANLGS